MRFLRAILLIAALELRVLVRSPRTWICALLVAAPAVIALLAGGSEEGARIYRGLAFMLLQFVAPLVGLVLGSVVISEEVEARTITYVFTRPIHRSAVFLGRWLAVGAVASALLGLGAVGTSQGSSHSWVREPEQRLEWAREFQRGERWIEAERGTRRFVRWEDEERQTQWRRVSGLEVDETLELSADRLGRPHRVRGVARTTVDLSLPTGAQSSLVLAAILGGLFYTMIIAGLSIFVKRPLIVGLGYAFAMEGVLANLPGSTQGLSVQHHLRSIVVQATGPELWSRFDVISSSDLLGSGEAVLRLAGFAGLFLAFCAWAIQRRQFVLTS